MGTSSQNMLATPSSLHDSSGFIVEVCRAAGKHGLRAKLTGSENYRTILVADMNMPKQRRPILTHNFVIRYTVNTEE
jgi:hypothetical protein